jgi:hypothetical protein
VLFRPGNRRVHRAALVLAGSASRNPADDDNVGRNPADHDNLQWIGGWLPWQHAAVPPTESAFQLPSPAVLVVELYYRGIDAETTDESAIDLSFAAETATQRIGQVVVDGVDRSASRVRGGVQLSQRATVWAIQPSLDPSVTSMELRAERPDGSVEVLLWIPKARAEWPLALVMQEPVSLPAGSTLSLLAETEPSHSAVSRARVTLSVLR